MNIFWKSFFHQFNLYEDGSVLMWLILILGISTFILNQMRSTALAEYLTKLLILFGIFNFLFLCFLSIHLYSIVNIPVEEKTGFMATGLSMSLLPLILTVMTLMILTSQKALKSIRES